MWNLAKLFKDAFLLLQSVSPLGVLWPSKGRSVHGVPSSDRAPPGLTHEDPHTPFPISLSRPVQSPFQRCCLPTPSEAGLSLAPSSEACWLICLYVGSGLFMTKLRWHFHRDPHGPHHHPQIAHGYFHNIARKWEVHPTVHVLELWFTSSSITLKNILKYYSQKEAIFLLMHSFSISN